MTEPHDWPAEQSAQGALRPWHYTTVGYLAAVFEDPEEALRAQRGLRDQGVPEADLRLYDAEEILGIASRLQQERSIVAKAINEVVVDHRVRERWLANAGAGGSQLWVHAPTKDRADRLVGLFADYHYLSLHYSVRTASKPSKGMSDRPRLGNGMIGVTETITATSDQACDLRIWSPGRTRTCNLRIRSRPRVVHAVSRGSVLAGQVG